MKINWAQFLSSIFFFSVDFHCKKRGTCYHFIDDVRVRVCAAEAGLKLR